MTFRSRIFTRRETMSSSRPSAKTTLAGSLDQIAERQHGNRTCPPLPAGGRIENIASPISAAAIPIPPPTSASLRARLGRRRDDFAADPREIIKTHLHCLSKLSRRTRTIIWIWRESRFKERDDRRGDAALRELSDRQRERFFPDHPGSLGRAVGKRNFSGQAIPKRSA